MVQACPNTDDSKHGKQWEHCSGYHYDEKTIIGFSHTHLSGTGCEDMGDILIMPVTGEPGFDPGLKEDSRSGYRSAFSHDTEEAHAPLQLHEATLHLPGGKTFTIKAVGLSETAKYVKPVSLNGETIDLKTLTYDQIMAGGELIYQMTETI